MPDHPQNSFSRRTVARTALALTAVGVFGPAAVWADGAPSDVVAHCRDWLAGEAEHDRLSQRWSSLESRMMRGRAWAQMTEAQRSALPEVGEMARIETELAAGGDRQERALSVLSRLLPETLSDAADLMRVAAHLLRYEGEQPRKLICNALRVVGRES